jgi:hypothetical protein
MAELIVTKALIDYLVSEVAPYVEQETKWQLDLKILKTWVIPREYAYEVIILKQSRNFLKGLPSTAAHSSFMIPPLKEKMFEANILGAFEPTSLELIIVQENVDDSNLDGLKVVIAHELTHFGQYLHHKKIFDQLDDMKSFITEAYYRQDEREVVAIMNRVQPLMTLLESHAYFIEEQIRKLIYPKARIESHFNWATMMMSLLAPNKQAQYLDGLPAIRSAVKENSLDDLFQRAC